MFSKMNFNWKNISEKVMTALPAIFAIIYVTMSSLTYAFIDSTSKPLDKESQDKLDKAKTASVVNLVLSVVIFVIVMMLYFRTFRMQKQYITYF